MRKLLVPPLALTLAGCLSPTWKAVKPGASLGQDTVVLVGSFSASPPISQHDLLDERRPSWVNSRLATGGKIVFFGETDGNVMAFFTPDLSERWDSAAASPLGHFSWAYIPTEGTFFLEIPRARHVYLRGFVYLTNAGMVRYELPATVELQSDDHIAYVGAIHVIRNGPPVARPPQYPSQPDLTAVEFHNQAEDAQRIAREHGLEQLLSEPWRVRMFHLFAPP